MNLPRCHWSELQKNKFLFKVRPEMLSDEGFVDVRNCLIEGDPNGKQHAVLREVIFDRDYVIQKLAKELEHFKETGINEVHSIIGEAKRYAKEQSKQ